MFTEPLRLSMLQKSLTRFLILGGLVLLAFWIFWLKADSSLSSPTAGKIPGHWQPVPNESQSVTTTPALDEDETNKKQEAEKLLASDELTSSLPTSENSHDGFQQHIDMSKALFRRHRPTFEPLTKYKNDVRAGKKAFDDKLPIFSNEELGEFLVVPNRDKEALRNSHAEFVAAIPKKPPTGAFSGTGAVYVTGGKYVPIMLISLRMLRRVSPSVPVEVFFGTKDEYEPDLCENVLPSLNAKCLVLEDIYGRDFFDNFDIQGYQFKALAILASSFENVVFLDSDNIAIQNIEQCIYQEPFLSQKYIVWPDYWFRTTSPHFYDIAAIKLGERVRGNLSVTDPSLIPQADLENAIPDKSSESGQLMLSKIAHYDSLLLATYYNLYGYTAYYPLLTQGGGGEGDKETFIAAALALGKSVHQIKEDIHPSGYFTPDFVGSGMMQSFPLDDYNKNTLGIYDGDPRILFIHFNVFKLNLPVVFDKYKEEFAMDNKRLRFLGKPSDNTQWYDFRDIELYMWLEAQWCACDMYRDKNVTIKNWQGSDATNLCEMTQNHVKWLIATHNV